MQIDVVNADNKKVGSVDLSDELFGGRVKVDLIHESVVRANAAARRGTHATKTRAMVSGSGKKPWRQKGTLRAALTQKLRDGAVTVVDALSVSEIKTKAASEMLRRLGIDGKALLVDVKP